MADDEVTAELKRIREQREWTAMPRLVAALEAVLKLHHPVFTDYADGDGIERSSYECAECEPPGTPDNWPCPTVRAITRELTGKEACSACGHKAHSETPAECGWCPEGYCEAQAWPVPPGFVVPKPTPFRPELQEEDGDG